MVVHVGSGPNHGHYISLVRSHKHWLLFDDESVELIDEANIQSCFGSSVDTAANTPQALRKFSYLIYCNEDWSEADGGCLRIHTDGGGVMPPAGAAPSYVDVAPKAGTLVVFRSDVPHEVLDTSASRLAVAGWFNAPPEGSSGRRKLIGLLAGSLVVGNGVKTLLAGLQGDGQ